jgi:hypothetical protein
MAIAALVTWLAAGAAGIYMFGTGLSRGTPRRPGGVPAPVIVTHLAAGALGFATWVGYLVTGWDALAWAGVGLLMPGIGFGICTVTLWAPYPAGAHSGPGGMLAAPESLGRVSDEALALALSSEVLAGRLIDDMLEGLPQPARRSRRHLAPLIPAGHGAAAVATFVLAVLSAIGGR